MQYLEYSITSSFDQKSEILTDHFVSLYVFKSELQYPYVTYTIDCNEHKPK